VTPHISDGTNSATYSYLANSPLVEQIASAQNAAARMTTTKAYVFANRLTNISHADPLAVVLASYSCGYNAANQRTNVVHADNANWAYDELRKHVTREFVEC
jgi:hypothetical protein